MTKEEYEIRLSELEQNHQNNLRALANEYALSNNPYKVGDFLIDHIGVMKVERIEVTYCSSGYTCVYFGTEYTRKLVPMKKQSGRGMYQPNVKEKIQETIR